MELNLQQILLMSEQKNIESAKNAEPYVPPPETRASDMELIWKCTNCGYIFPVGTPLPETCPNCGKPKQFFEHVVED